MIRKKPLTIAAWLLSVMMVFTMMPNVAFAEETPQGETDVVSEIQASEDVQIENKAEEPEEETVVSEDEDTCKHTDAEGNDFCDTCGEYIGKEETENIPVKLVIPEGSEARFYAGKKGKGTPIAAVDNGVNDDNALIHTYDINVPKGSYSCIVSDGEHNYGGVGFDVPLQSSIYENTNITLVLVKFYTTTSSVKINGVATPVEIDSVDDFNVDLVAPGKCEIIPGDNYIDGTIKSGTDYVVAPRMVWAYGNQILYNYTVNLNDELSKSMGVSPQINQTFASTLTAVQKKTFSIVALKSYKLTSPTDADTTFFYQINNFNDMILEGDNRVMSEDNEDGTTTYTVYYPGFAYASYRVAEEGYVTAAGYCKDNTEYTVELRKGDPESTKTAIDSKVGAGSNIEYENSVYLNVDDTKDTNELAMNTGETFRLRAFRAAWEIVNSVTANIMIEPDFHYSILSGDDVVEVTPVTDQCTGNATGNWMDIKALKDGTALIAVWYDAIDIAGNTTLSGTYGATEPNRYGYVLVNVGPDHNVTWNPVSHDGDWDAEFDTVYYYGKNGTFTIAPDGAKSVTVNNIKADKKYGTAKVSAEDGKYNVPVKNGSNLITVNTENGTDYMLVRAKRIDYSIENKTTGEIIENGAPDINRGDEVCIHFDQFNMPVAKMSGIYNPGYTGTAKTIFKLNDKYTLASTGTQYDYITDEKSCITFTANVEGKNTLSDGYIQSGSMGDKFGNHRNITDAGRGTNFSAVNVTGYFGTIEDITFEVGKKDYSDPSLTELKKVELYCGSSSFDSGFKFTTMKEKNGANWTKANDSYVLSATVTPKSYYNDLKLRWWYDGEEEHTAELEQGIEFRAPADEFKADSEKILNIQIIVTPADGTPAKIYSYVVYPGNANLKYVHPVISSLKITDADGSGKTIESDTAFDYNNTEYLMEAESTGSINMEADMLQKYTNATKNTQDKADTVRIQLMKNGRNVGGEREVYPLTEDRYPTGKWSIKSLDISEADAIKLKVTSYVDETSREYTIKLHDAVTDKPVQATVFKTGLTEGSHCAKCNKVLSEQKSVAKLKPTIKLSATSVKLKKKKKYNLTVSGLAKGDSVKSVKSSKKSVANVKKTANGKYRITAKKKGKANIKVKLTSGKTAICKVRVKR